MSKSGFLGYCVVCFDEVVELCFIGNHEVNGLRICRNCKATSTPIGREL